MICDLGQPITNMPIASVPPRLNWAADTHAACVSDSQNLLTAQAARLGWRDVIGKGGEQRDSQHGGAQCMGGLREQLHPRQVTRYRYPACRQNGQAIMPQPSSELSLPDSTTPEAWRNSRPVRLDTRHRERNRR